MRVLAVDPGFERVGIAVIEGNRRKADLIFSECFQTPKTDLPERFKLIGREIKKLIKKHKPRELAIETIIFNKNQKTALSVAAARGVIIYEAAEAGLKISEYSPLEIKMSITGYGRAEKRQIAEMVKRFTAIPRDVRSDDEVDAIAAGLAHLSTVSS